MIASAWLTALLLLVLSATAMADEGCLVSFDSAAYDVCEEEATLVNENLAHLADPAGFDDSSIRVVKFDAAVTAEQRDTLAGTADVEVLGYVPFFAFLVRMDPATDETVEAIDGVSWVGPYLPVWKVGVNLARELAGAGMVAAAELTELVISLHPEADPDTVITVITDTDGIVFQHSEFGWQQQRLIVNFLPDALMPAVDALAVLDEVAAINLRWPVALFNANAGWLHQSGSQTPSPQRPIFDQGIFGCGQVIGVLDTGLHVDHCSFHDPSGVAVAFDSCNSGTNCTGVTEDLNHRKVGAYYEWSGLNNGMADIHGHGTHVAGSVIGNDINDPVDCSAFTTPGGLSDLDGSAPGAKLIFQESGDQNQYLGGSIGGTIYHAGDIAYQNQARIHNNSWGYPVCRDSHNNCISSCTVPYHQSSRDADGLVWDLPEMALFVAAGNSGADCGPGADVAAPGNAKNVFSIGANQRGVDGDNVSNFSSRGPSSDRRTRPDMTAQGGQRTSNANLRIHSSATNTSCGSEPRHGTSMASPTAAGLGALVREYLARGFYPGGVEDPATTIPDPSSALIRALMINGAREIDGPDAGFAPGRHQGWGRIHLDDVLFFDGDSRELWIDDNQTGLDAGDLVETTHTVYAHQPLKATLVWHDFPALVNANPHIVNQLRLEVETPNGDVWTQKLLPGGGLSAADPYQSTSSTDYDDRNTVHQILIDHPEPGDYIVRVIGLAINQGNTQPYALAVTGAFQPAPTQPGLNVTPEVVDYGNVALGISNARAVTLTNGGAGGLDIDAITPTGQHFQLTADTTCTPPPFHLAAGATCTLDYAFEPTVSGQIIETVEIQDNAQATLGSFELRGIGDGVGVAMLDGVVPLIDFGNLCVGDFDFIDQIIANHGTEPLSVTDIDAVSSPFSDFGGSCPDTPFVLNPGHQCSVRYMFTALASGDAVENVDIDSNDPNSPFPYVIEGTGIDVEIDLITTHIDFGPVAVGTIATGHLDIENPGLSCDVMVFAPGSSPLPPEFRIEPGNCGASFPVTLLPQSSCTLDVEFEPSTTQSYIHNDFLPSDATAGATDYTLEGQGVPPAPELQIAPNPLDFGTHVVGQTAGPETVTLTNIGSATLDITSISSPSPPFHLHSGSCAPVSLNPGDFCELEYLFEPTATGPADESIDIDSNDPAGTGTLDLEGEGVSPQIFHDRFQSP